MVSHLCPFLIKIIYAYGFHGNQIGVIVATLLLEKFH